MLNKFWKWFELIKRSILFCSKLDSTAMLSSVITWSNKMFFLHWYKFTGSCLLAVPFYKIAVHCICQVGNDCSTWYLDIWLCINIWKTLWLDSMMTMDMFMCFIHKPVFIYSYLGPTTGTIYMSTWDQHW